MIHNPNSPHFPKRRNPPRKTSAAGGAASPAQDEGALSAEISALRLLSQRVEILADEAGSLDDLLRILDGLGKTSTRIATLLKAQQQLRQAPDLAGAINAALAEVIHDLEQNQAQSGR